jgi:tRNA-2-methylthio-N6-dimethylallyladenosine synthase
MSQLPEDVKDERLQILQSLILEQQNAFNKSFIGKKLEVLLEKPGRHPTQITGRSQYMQAVHVDNADQYLGKVVTVNINELRTNSLGGSIIDTNTILS